MIELLIAIEFACQAWTLRNAPKSGHGEGDYFHGGNGVALLTPRKQAIDTTETRANAGVANCLVLANSSTGKYY